MATSRGRENVHRYMQRLPADLKKVLHGAGRAGGKVIAEEAKRLSRSEVVSSNVIVEAKATTAHIDVRVTVKKGWARSVGTWLEYGTDPHLITVDASQRQGRTTSRINRLSKEPDSSHSLVIGGKFVGATVFHMGAQPYPFLRPARDTHKGDAVATAQRYIDARVTRAGVDTSGEEDGA